MSVPADSAHPLLRSMIANTAWSFVLRSCIPPLSGLAAGASRRLHPSARGGVPSLHDVAVVWTLGLYVNRDVAFIVLLTSCVCCFSVLCPQLANTIFAVQYDCDCTGIYCNRAGSYTQPYYT